MSVFIVGCGNEQCRGCEHIEYNSKGPYCAVLYPVIEDGICKTCSKTTEK